MNKITGILIVLVVFIFSSCSVILSKIYGVNKIESFDKELYEDFISKYENDQVNFKSIISDTIQYKSIINLGKDSMQRHSFGQPVQILYFENKKLKSFHANCFARGISNLNWNTDNRFSFFLPKTALEIDTLNLSLEKYNKIYNQININSTKKYTVLIFWTLMIEKISNSAIETVINNINRFDKNNEIEVYFINSDKFFATK